MTMKHVRIAERKARLSEYLRAVRRGETITGPDSRPSGRILNAASRPNPTASLDGVL
jgi:antitoxin (DNA-binding transcriptional repressor) of toxin-antitoxin stability system